MPPETTTPGGILQGPNPPHPTVAVPAAFPGWFPMEDTKRPVFGAEAERIGTRLDEATDEFLKELHGGDGLRGDGVAGGDMLGGIHPNVSPIPPQKIRP